MSKYLLLFLIFLISCSSQESKSQYNRVSMYPPIYYSKDPDFIEFSNFIDASLDEKKQSEIPYEENGRTFSIGHVSGTMEKDRDELCLHAENMAKRRIVNYLGQSLQYGLNIRGKNVDFGSDERSSAELAGIKFHECYFEKESVQVYARVSIETDKLEKLREDSEKEIKKRQFAQNYREQKLSQKKMEEDLAKQEIFVPANKKVDFGNINQIWNSLYGKKDNGEPLSEKEFNVILYKFKNKYYSASNKKFENEARIERASALKLYRKKYPVARGWVGTVVYKGINTTDNYSAELKIKLVDGTILSTTSKNCPKNQNFERGTSVYDSFKQPSLKIGSLVNFTGRFVVSDSKDYFCENHSTNQIQDIMLKPEFNFSFENIVLYGEKL